MTDRAKYVCASLPHGSSPFLCRVHSVFDHAVNLTHDDTMIPVLPCTSDAVVGGITLQGNTLPAVIKGQTIDIAPLLQGERINNTLHPEEYVQYQKAEILHSTPSVFGGGDPLSPVILEKVHTFIKDPCAENIQNILGLGIGLTPSCDDFLVGWMAVCRILGKEPPPIDEKDLSCTTAVSRHYLLHGINGRFSPTVRRCAAAMIGREDPAVYQQMIGFGHTSGADTLWGMQMCMENLK